jgi:hypothetical protein
MFSVTRVRPWFLSSSCITLSSLISCTKASLVIPSGLDSASILPLLLKKSLTILSTVVPAMRESSYAISFTVSVKLSIVLSASSALARASYFLLLNCGILASSKADKHELSLTCKLSLYWFYLTSYSSVVLSINHIELLIFCSTTYLRLAIINLLYSLHKLSSL